MKNQSESPYSRNTNIQQRRVPLQTHQDFYQVRQKSVDSQRKHHTEVDTQGNDREQEIIQFLLKVTQFFRSNRNFLHDLYEKKQVQSSMPLILHQKQKVEKQLREIIKFYDSLKYLNKYSQVVSISTFEISDALFEETLMRIKDLMSQYGEFDQQFESQIEQQFLKLKEKIYQECATDRHIQPQQTRQFKIQQLQNTISNLQKENLVLRENMNKLTSQLNEINNLVQNKAIRTSPFQSCYSENQNDKFIKCTTPTIESQHLLEQSLASLQISSIKEELAIKSAQIQKLITKSQQKMQKRQISPQSSHKSNQISQALYSQNEIDMIKQENQELRNLLNNVQQFQQEENQSDQQNDNQSMKEHLSQIEANNQVIGNQLITLIEQSLAFTQEVAPILEQFDQNRQQISDFLNELNREYVDAQQLEAIELLLESEQEQQRQINEANQQFLSEIQAISEEVSNGNYENRYQDSEQENQEKMELKEVLNKTIEEFQQVQETLNKQILNEKKKCKSLEEENYQLKLQLQNNQEIEQNLKDSIDRRLQEAKRRASFYKEQMDVAEQATVDLENQITAIQDKFKEDNDKYIKQIELLQALNEEKQQAIEQIKNQLQECQQNYKSKLQVTDQFNQKINEQQSQIQELIKKNEINAKKSNQLSIFEQVFVQIKQNIALQINQAQKQNIQQLQQIQNKTLSADSQLLQLESSFKMLYQKDLLDSINKKIVQIIVQLQDVMQFEDEDQSNLIKNIEKLKQCIQQLCYINNQNEEQNKKLTQQLKQFQKQQIKKKQELDQLQNVSLQNEEFYQSQIKQLNQENEQLNDLNQNIQQHLEELKEENDVLLQKFKKTEQKLQKQQEQIQQLQQIKLENDKLNNDLKHLKCEIPEAQQFIKHYQNTIQQLKYKNSLLKNQKQNKLSSLEEDYEKLLNDFQASKMSNQIHQEEILNLKTQNSDLQLKLQTLENETHNLKIKNQSLTGQQEQINSKQISQLKFTVEQQSYVIKQKDQQLQDQIAQSQVNLQKLKSTLQNQLGEIQKQNQILILEKSKDQENVNQLKNDIQD